GSGARGCRSDCCGVEGVHDRGRACRAARGEDGRGLESLATTEETSSVVERVFGPKWAPAVTQNSKLCSLNSVGAYRLDRRPVSWNVAFGVAHDLERGQAFVDRHRRVLLTIIPSA